MRSASRRSRTCWATTRCASTSGRSSPAAMPDLAAIVRSSYEAFGRGDLDGALAMMDAEIVWHQAQGLPHGGVYHGLAAVRAAVFDPLDEEWWDEFDAAPAEVLTGDDHAV